jgi:thiamine biosynthesis protein ThiS
MNRKREDIVKIVVNGSSRSYKGRVTVSTVLRQAGAACDRVAVVVNGEIVSRPAFGTRVLKNNDKLEILTYAAGG